MTDAEKSQNAAGAIHLHQMMDRLYDEIEFQTWLSIEQRDHLLHQVAVLIAQYEGIARWNIGENLGSKEV